MTGRPRAADTLTLQFPSSSDDKIMVPHALPDMPLQEKQGTSRQLIGTVLAEWQDGNQVSLCNVISYFYSAYHR